MEEYQRIVIATDGTEENRLVIDKGLSLARLIGAKTKIVFVVDTGTLSGLPPDELITAVEDHIEGEAEDILNDLEKKAEEIGVDLEKSIKKGAPAEIITSESEKGDLIVMGHHTRSGLSRLFTGSTARKVIRDADCPVMVVRLEED